MTEFVALSPKVYANKKIRLDNSLTEHKRANDIKKKGTKKSLCWICTISVNSKMKYLIAYNIG